MTTVILIISALLLLFIALQMLRLRFIFVCGDDVELYVKVLFYKKKIYPEEPRKIRISDYSYKNFMKRRKKQLKKRSKLLAKISKKKEHKKDLKIPHKKSAVEIIELIKTLISMFRASLPRFFKHLRVDIAKLRINVGADDPASTAIIYGVIAQLTAYFVEFINNITNLKKNSKSDISVNADFLSDEITYDIHFEFSLRIWHLLDIGLRMAYNYLKSKPEFSSKTNKVKNS